MRVPRGYHMRRRDFLVGSALAATTGACAKQRGCDLGAPEPIWGVQSGEVTSSTAVLWSRSDRVARLSVEYATSKSFAGATRVVGPLAVPENDLTAKLLLDGLPPGERIFYRAWFEADRASQWLEGSFVTAPRDGDGARDVVFAWSGDTNGQGWGIDPARGGMPAYTAVLDRKPDFFVHAGDAVYADNPIPAQIMLRDGTFWKNVTTPAKSAVAQTLDDYRGAFLYPRHSAEVRALSAATSLFAIWDDHEVRNNWFPGQIVPPEDPGYGVERRIDALAAAARVAMHEHTPTLRDLRAPSYRSHRWGPRLELFMLDGRSYRSPDYPAAPDPAQRFLGDVQLDWLVDALARSTATWKVIVCDMPLSYVSIDPSPPSAHCEPWAFEAFATGDGEPAGRETELARLLATLAERKVKNFVFLTADVHYAAAIRHDPAKSRVPGKMPAFWEFVAGPLHAGAFPELRRDDTFGPDVAYVYADGGDPARGGQSFGVVRVDGASGALTVTLVDGRGRDLHSTTVPVEV